MDKLTDKERHILTLIDEYLLTYGVNKKEFIDRLKRAMCCFAYKICEEMFCKKMDYRTSEAEIINLRLSLLGLKMRQEVIVTLTELANVIKLIDGYLKNGYIASDFVDRFSQAYLKNKKFLTFLSDFYEDIQFFTSNIEWSLEDPNLFSDESRLRRMSERQRKSLVKKWFEKQHLESPFGE